MILFPGQSPAKRKQLELWLETLAIPVLAMALQLWMAPKSLFSASEFPWVWLAPVLIALRYGLMPGIGAAWVLVLGFFVLSKYQIIDTPMPSQQFLGGIILVLLCGQFSDLWRRRLDKQQIALEYNEQRLTALTRDFYVTRISHDILEQNLITQPATLRNAFEELRKLIEKDNASLTGEAAKNLLILLSHYNRLESAALFPVVHDRPLNHPSATLGLAFELNVDDPLVTAAIEKRTDAFYAVSQIISEKVSDYLAVIPIESYTGKLYGLLVVADMPFLALNEENLLMTKAILQYFADELSIYEESVPLRKHFPQCPPAFGKELLKLSRLKRLIDIDSSLIAITIPPGHKQAAILEALEKTKRGLDLHWIHSPDSQTVILLKLMPLTSTIGAEGFLHRFAEMLLERFQATASELNLRLDSRLLPPEDLVDWLDEYIGYTHSYPLRPHLSSA
ncbi:MAG: hypothetical protein AXA67_07085 [Methylothermaceae bacteria B42]|nr:MAG: hypothetical protein AXA67_07085 [Methylothermaceae bacteria B42]HHJ40211.1 hypothetical protein [Methylothermaceae bacterium]